MAGTRGKTATAKQAETRRLREENRSLKKELRRKAVVEPVNGQIKDAQGFRRFSFRGLQAVEAEWNLVCLCHNVLKLFRYGAEFAPEVK